MEKLQKILENYNPELTEKQIKDLSEVLEFHNHGILPASVVKRILKISYKETHELMVYLMTKDMLKPKYKVYCENDMVTGAVKIYDDPAQVPVSFCDRCDKGCSLIKNLVVEFEVCV
ncbi:hypothetical protein ACSXEI_00305 [Clostridium perfringens]